MQANANDRIVVRSHQVGDPEREAVILEAHGPDGSPPYRVRWADGHESVFVPSSDSVVQRGPA